MCCCSYRGRLRAIKLFLWLHGSAEYIKMKRKWVTDEAIIAETAVWPNFFLMNVFFALKGSKLFIIICGG